MLMCFIVCDKFTSSSRHKATSSIPCFIRTKQM
nr:MAG TPA: hypothetical protein [Caudoviricetes sp.]DAG28806.1 MAG TPA: hypothetical protein [Caudoviricetes sp.]